MLLNLSVRLFVPIHPVPRYQGDLSFLSVQNNSFSQPAESLSFQQETFAKDFDNSQSAITIDNSGDYQSNLIEEVRNNKHGI